MDGVENLTWPTVSLLHHIQLTFSHSSIFNSHSAFSGGKIALHLKLGELSYRSWSSIANPSYSHLKQIYFLTLRSRSIKVQDNSVLKVFEA